MRTRVFVNFNYIFFHMLVSSLKREHTKLNTIWNLKEFISRGVPLAGWWCRTTWPHRPSMEQFEISSIRPGLKEVRWTRTFPSIIIFNVDNAHLLVWDKPNLGRKVNCRLIRILLSTTLVLGTIAITKRKKTEGTWVFAFFYPHRHSTLFIKDVIKPAGCPNRESLLRSLATNNQERQQWRNRRTPRTPCGSGFCTPRIKTRCAREWRGADGNLQSR